MSYFLNFSRNIVRYLSWAKELGVFAITDSTIGLIHILTKLMSYHNDLSIQYRLIPPVINIILYIFSQSHYLIHIWTQITFMMSISMILGIHSHLEIHVNIRCKNSNNSSQTSKPNSFITTKFVTATRRITTSYTRKILSFLSN